MGADLYLNGETSRTEGMYFRDSYNSTCLLWRLGLSWWADAPSGEVRGEKLVAFRDLVAKATFRPVTLEETTSPKCRMEIDDNENSIENWNKFFLAKREALLGLLDKAIETQGFVLFSI